ARLARAALAAQRGQLPPPVVHARGDVHFQRAADGHVALPAAGRAQVGDDEAAAAAPGAGLLDAEKPLVAQHGPAAVPPPAPDRRAALAGARAAAVAAHFLARDGDRLGAAGVGLAQVQLQRVEQVLAGLRAVRPPPAAEEVAEQVADDVEERRV